MLKFCLIVHLESILLFVRLIMLILMATEMNLHVPQSQEARAEASLLMKVQDQIISPRYGGPIIGGIRDFITGAFLLTMDDTSINFG